MIGDRRASPPVRVVPWGPAVLLVAVVAGVFVGEARGGSAAVDAACVAIATGLLACAARSRRVRLASCAFAFALLGVVVMQRALHGIAVSPLTAAVDTRTSATARATLLDDPDASRFATDVLVRVDAVDGRDAGRRRVVVKASGDVAGRVRLLEAGDHAVVRGWFAPLEGFDTRWQWRHAVGSFHATALDSAQRATAPMIRAANTARAAVLGGARSLEPTDRALLAGFLLGDTRGVPRELTDDFRAAGLSHLTAVSGENVAFVLALIAPVLRRLALRGRLVGALSVLVLFGTMTRWEPSVLRAIVMASIALVAGHLGRPVHGVRVLLLAAITLLLVDPFLVHSVGFALSCAASLGITLFARPIADRLRGPAWLREVLGVTAAAQLAVAPIVIPVFGSMPLVALPANLVAVPLAAPLTMWGLLSGLVGGLFVGVAPVVARVLAIPTTALLHGLVAVAEVAARVPFTVDGRAAWGLVSLAAGCVLVVRWSAARRVGSSR